MEGTEGIGNSLFPCPDECELEPLGMAAPTPFLPGLARSGVRMGNLGAREYGVGNRLKAPSEPFGPSQTRCCPCKLQFLASPRAAHSPPPHQRAPLFSIPEASPWPTSSRLQRDSSLVHRTSPDLSGRSCSPRALPFSSVSRTARPYCFLQPDRGPSAPFAWLRVSLAPFQAGKVPRARPRRGRLLSLPLREGAGSP